MYHGKVSPHKVEGGDPSFYSIEPWIFWSLDHTFSLPMNHKTTNGNEGVIHRFSTLDTGLFGIL